MLWRTAMLPLAILPMFQVREMLSAMIGFITTPGCGKNPLTDPRIPHAITLCSYNEMNGVSRENGKP
jgi:hypothetical protein